MKVADEVGRLLRDGGGAVSVREHPGLERGLQRLAAAGRLRALLPGVYVRAEEFELLPVRIRAAALWAPEAVLTGPAAAWCTFWPKVAVPAVTLSTPAKRSPPRGFLVTRERIPGELVRWHGSCPVTGPALTALDLVATCGGAGIDRALLTRAASLAQMQEALTLTAGRRGNRERRALLHDSRDEPWSAAERYGHALLRAAGIRGWRANVAVRVEGQLYFLDIALLALRIAIEIDGYQTHRAENRKQFEQDRGKWSRLTAAGWRVLHFTWLQLTEEPDWVVAVIRRTMADAQVSGIDRNRGRRPPVRLR